MNFAEWNSTGTYRRKDKLSTGILFGGSSQAVAFIA
jgi:hypothetical protein